MHMHMYDNIHHIIKYMYMWELQVLFKNSFCYCLCINIRYIFNIKEENSFSFKMTSYTEKRRRRRKTCCYIVKKSNVVHTYIHI